MRKIDMEYLELKKMLAKMSQLSTSMIEDSISSLVERDSELAEDIIKRDDDVDAYDTEIDEFCLKALALYEPKAVDLRFITTALRIIVDLERIGDHCVEISKEVIRLNKIPPVKPYIDLPKMAESASSMVKNSVTAYFEKDIKLAINVIKKDDYIDDLHGQILRELITYIAEDIRKTKGAISLMFITRSLERIADHATNIAEMVYFMVTGKIIKHTVFDDKDIEKLIEEENE